MSIEVDLHLLDSQSKNFIPGLILSTLFTFLLEVLSSLGTMGEGVVDILKED
jgi:hypothetical protein